VAAGAQLLDTRDPGAFGAAHLKGSLNIGLVGQYATWAGTLLDRERPIVIVADPGTEGESALRLGRIGFDHVRGYLEGGLAAVERRPDLIGSTDRLSPDRAAAQMRSAGALALDVRTAAEREKGAIEGSLHVPLSRLRERLGEVPGDRPILVLCAGGYRSSIAASLLKREGVADVSEIAGGMTAWDARQKGLA
jgi:rhodanese-related sulfurtransferase